MKKKHTALLSASVLFVTVNIYVPTNQIWPPSESLGYILSMTYPAVVSSVIDAMHKAVVILLG